MVWFLVYLLTPKTHASYAATTSTAANPDHGYVLASVRSREQSPDVMPLPDSDPNTPVKPKGKKQRAEMSLHELQNNIVGIISTKINERADNLESMINHNTVSIDALKKSIDFAFAEVDSLKTDMKEYLTKNKLRFAVDLTSADKTFRDKLWPIIEAAKKEGKKAHFAGVRVIIDGKEVRPSLPPK
ncbi:unnamed protein product [Arctogadus glacialis]